MLSFSRIILIPPSSATVASQVIELLGLAGQAALRVPQVGVKTRLGGKGLAAQAAAGQASVES